MACLLTVGRSVPCKELVGGIKGIGFINDGDLGAITYNATTTDTIDTIDGETHVFWYDLKGVSTFTQNTTSSREAGTTYWEQVLEVTLPKLTVADHKQLRLLTLGNPKVVIRDNNDNFFLAGLEFGCDVTGGTIVTGGAMGDMSGYTLTLTGMEKKPANFFDDATYATLATNCNFIFVFGDGTFVS